MTSYVHEYGEVWTNSIVIEIPQTVGGEYGYDSHHCF